MSDVATEAHKVTDTIAKNTPLIVHAVMLTEKELPEATKEDKLANALALIMLGAHIGETTMIPQVEAIAQAVDLISSLVSAFHKAGLFQHHKNVPVVAPV